MVTPEQRAREEIDRLLAAAGWAVQDYKNANLHSARGVALREFELTAGHGTADYLLYVDAFSSPSTAAAVVLGRSANGRIEWKDAHGRTVKWLQEQEAARG